MAKEAPCFLDMGCGYEEYPMRTIGYSTTVFTLQMLALEIGRRKGAVSDADYAAYCEEAKRLPELLSPVPGMTMEWLQKKSQWQMIRSQCLVFTGSAAQYGVSLESAVKAWETPKDDIRRPGAREGMHGATTAITAIIVSSCSTTAALTAKRRSPLQDICARYFITALPLVRRLSARTT